MSQPTDQQPSPTKRPRSARGTKKSTEKHVAAATGSKVAVQPVVPSEASSKPQTSEPPVGEKWGEFPPPERQTELKRMLEAWDQEQDHGNRPSPFARVKLTGADVYWLAALVAGEGDVSDGRKKFAEKAGNFTRLSNLSLEGADLRDAHLEEAGLREADLKGAILDNADLKGAILDDAYLEEAHLSDAHLEGASLYGADLKGAILDRAHLEGAILGEAYLEGAILSKAHLEGAYVLFANLQGAILDDAHLEEAGLSDAHLEGAYLEGAYLEGAGLSKAHLEGAHLSKAHLEGADLSEADLTRQVDLSEATFDFQTKLAGVHLDATLLVADVHWNGVPLTQVDWEQVPSLGDEVAARQARRINGVRKEKDDWLRSFEAWYRASLSRKHHHRKEKDDWLRGFEAAARAYRQLAIAMRGQGITEAADRFTYRAQIMQRKALWWQVRNRKLSKLGAYIFSLFLAALTGYGFRMWRIVAAYTLLILVFAGAYWSLDLQTPHIYTFWQALILSVTAFHGRVFSNPFLLTEPQIVVTAIEAIFGLVIEGVFIAMLTQRFFNR